MQPTRLRITPHKMGEAETQARMGSDRLANRRRRRGQRLPRTPTAWHRIWSVVDTRRSTDCQRVLASYRRLRYDVNFLVIEIKREQSRNGVPADLKKIRDDWFADNLHYRFGAEVILDENRHGVEIQILSRQQKDEQPLIKTLANMDAQLTVPDFARVRRETLSKAVDRIAAAKQSNAEADTSAMEREMDELVYALYGLTPEEIELVEGAAQ